MNKYQQKHIITLSSRQRKQLQDIIRKGTHNVREVKRASVLLQSDAGKKDSDIAKAVSTTIRTVERIRARFTEGNIGRALYDAKRSGQPSKLNDTAEAHLVALACSDPPEGRNHWTLELLQKQMIRDGKVKKISTVALWTRLNERKIKPWREKNVVHSQAHA